MTGVDPAIQNRFAEILANTRANAATITDRVEAQKREISEQSQRLREQNERMCKELDERSQAKAAAKDDPAAKNQWLRRSSPAEDSTFQFGEVDEQPQKPPERTDRVPSPRPARTSRRDEDFDDEDFTHKNWLD